MIILISPAKSLNLDTTTFPDATAPLFKSEVQDLVGIMRSYDIEALARLMGISVELAQENVKRFHNFRTRHNSSNSKQAIFTFAGDVYRGLQAEEWQAKDLVYAKDHLRILSGLYGILRPLDLIQPYRLEMGSRIITPSGVGLYRFWGDKISKQLNKDLRALDQKTIINLASNEYWKAVDLKALKAHNVIHINFMEYRDGEAKFISYSAKVARGLMARFIIQNRITDMASITHFCEDNYQYDPGLSTDNKIIFSR